LLLLLLFLALLLLLLLELLLLLSVFLLELLELLLVFLIDLLLALLLKEIPYFTQEEILGGIPQALATKHGSKYSAVIAKALRRHVEWRTQTALEFWRELSSVTSEG